MAASLLCWQRPIHEGAAPRARGGHAAAQVGNLMVVHGGTFALRGKFTYLGDTWALDTDAAPLKWTPVTLGGGAQPAARYGHSLTLLGGAGAACLALFGGRAAGGLTLNDLWEVNVEEWRARLLPSSSAPPSPRMGHAAVAVGARLLVFGGWDGEACAAPELWLYDRAAQAWARPRTGGIPPAPRHGAAASFDALRGRLFVFGGAGVDGDGVPVPLADVRELSLRDMTWARAAVSGDTPTARSGAAAVAVANAVVLLGGWRGPEEFTARPRVPPPAEVTVPHRPGMGFGALPPAPGATITVPAGQHPDFYLFDTDTGAFVRPPVCGAPPGYRYGATLVAAGGRCIAYGGWEDGAATSEVLEVDLSVLAAPA